MVPLTICRHLFPVKLITINAVMWFYEGVSSYSSPMWWKLRIPVFFKYFKIAKIFFVICCPLETKECGWMFWPLITLRKHVFSVVMEVPRLDTLLCGMMRKRMLCGCRVAAVWSVCISQSFLPQVPQDRAFHFFSWHLCLSSVLMS